MRSGSAAVVIAQSLLQADTASWRENGGAQAGDGPHRWSRRDTEAIGTPSLLGAIGIMDRQAWADPINDPLNVTESHDRAPGDDWIDVRRL